MVQIAGCYFASHFNHTCEDDNTTKKDPSSFEQTKKQAKTDVCKWLIDQQQNNCHRMHLSYCIVTHENCNDEVNFKKNLMKVNSPCRKQKRIDTGI